MEVKALANIKSAKKRIRVTERKTAINRKIKSQTKTAVKKVNLAIENNDKENVEDALKYAVKRIDMAASKGVFHKNNAARQKSKLTKKVNDFLAV